MSEILKELSKYAAKMVDTNLVVGAGGNLSVRDDTYMYISPSGYDLKEITEEDWVKVKLETGEVMSELKPSSELEMHLECFRRSPGIKAVLHAHPTYSIAVSSAGQEIQPMFPDYPAMVKKVSYIDYVIPTNHLIAEAVGEVVAESQAVVMRNHGVLTVGATMKEAFFYMQLTEEAAKVYAISSMVGKPNILSEEECDDLRNLSAETYRSSLLKKQKL
ncbi:class II aldolase/adducin family protein [Salinicoccus hispanicus]|uniref:Class II aldolase/adducin family protein n=1 Tax=Salinicoccus hispanicus TaxID=157225 RepID=A0A6N8U447_9STAP|nr:class II aldolase/adducin family protein [Salinicoccus hispanicus]MXQ51011.1 class II aldolase/adducin family protein [Salinicoccus hispanicus]